MKALGVETRQDFPLSFSIARVAPLRIEGLTSLGIAPNDCPKLVQTIQRRRQPFNGLCPYTLQVVVGFSL